MGSYYKIDLLTCLFIINQDIKLTLIKYLASGNLSMFSQIQDYSRLKPSIWIAW